MNVLSQEEIRKKVQVIEQELKSSTWRDLETRGKFDKNDKLSFKHKVALTTYVLFSGKIEDPMTEYTEGINTYRIIPITMTGHDADKVIAELEEKKKHGEPITKADLVPLTLCPLMGGEMSQKERIQRSLKLLSEPGTETVPREDIQKIEAVIYAMAEKFLDSSDVQEWGGVSDEKRISTLGGLSSIVFGYINMSRKED